MLVLRKALFHRDVEARKVAICGYLMILKKIHFLGKVSLSQSQTSVSSQASSSSLISTQVKADVYVGGSNLSAKTMCLEIMGLLKRALMQQGEIRQLLYEGLSDVILQNISLKDIILELLLGQFEKYYIVDNAEIPINFDMCFQDGKNILEEPLAHLITSIHLILLEASKGTSDDDLEEDYNESAQKMLEDSLQNLINRMCEIDINDICVTNKDDETSDENDCRGG
ncbi:Fanconi anemia group I protein-like protein, partial [Stegodyphus mimosarum]